MRTIERLLVLLLRQVNPEAAYRDDYEMLIRMARRCAYDFSHAADDLTDRPGSYMTSVEWHQRAQSWTRLFAKGNPGKDYRTRLSEENTMMLMALQDAERALEAAGVKVPASVLRHTGDIPF